MTDNADKSMDDIVSLCKRRGFVYPASEIYGGINGFWDYGPLGTQLKNNLRDAWWEAMVLNPPKGPDGERLQIVGLDSSIIQNPKVWEASGHLAGFADPMRKCAGCGHFVRADQLWEMLATSSEWVDSLLQVFTPITGDIDTPRLMDWARKKGKKLAPNLALVRNPEVTLSWLAQRVNGQPDAPVEMKEFMRHVATEQLNATGLQEPCPRCGGELGEPAPFKLMFETWAGMVQNDDNKAYLRPETAQGIFINFKNVVDTSRVKVPFGIAQVGKAFRNEVTPRNFIFRSREFEQMEMEWFCHKDDATKWYKFWQTERKRWWESLGLTSDNLIMREHDKDELSHYAKEGAGTADVEYRYPFTAPGFGELEGIAHRSNFDLTQHENHSRTKLKYFDSARGELAKNGQPKGEHYLPDVIEPAAGLTRGVLALLCEAYTRDDSRPSPEFLKLHPRLAPIKAAVFPLVKKDGMPEVAEKLHDELQQRFGRTGFIETDAKQSIGKRYARMDEAGCPWCFTIDGDSLTEHTVTARNRDTGEQQRIAIAQVGDFLHKALNI
ncbi:MAG: glycine--tRNA ligase [Planctomycetota bacterium]|nr:glycine--tRNA ligase [Planctomycetota bacterium]